MANQMLNLHQRLHAVMKEVEYVQKEKKNGMNYSIVSHDAVTAKVRPALVKHGIVYYPMSMNRNQDGNRTELDVVVRFVNVDQPTDYIDVACVGYGIDSQDKGPGKATSYAVKYALLKALGLETGDDPDNDSIPHDSFDPISEGKSIAAAIKAAPHSSALNSLMASQKDALARIKETNQKAYERLMKLVLEREEIFNQAVMGG